MAFSSSLISIIIIFILFTCQSLCLSSNSSNIEGNALRSFRKRISDPSNVLKSWNASDHCFWFYITCDSNNHVSRLDLGNTNISGIIDPELAHLKNLQYLELYQNNLSGKIPDELGNLEELVSLDLYGNQLEGPIPQSFTHLKALKYLRLNDNKLSGPIPKELANLTGLTIFNVSNNDLCGTIPDDGAFRSFHIQRLARSECSAGNVVAMNTIISIVLLSKLLFLVVCLY